MVDLVLLHGPPASGKLTIANELSELVGGRVLHNHLTLDVAKALLDFGEPEFWDLVHELRRVALQSYFKHATNTLISTWCYEDPEDRALFEQIKAIATAADGRVLPVFLNCDLANLEQRVGNAHRKEMEKLVDVDLLRQIMSVKNYRAIPDELCFEIDSNTKSAQYNAEAIRSNFNLCTS